MTRNDERHVDVLVIGGGPAGATAAGLLASWGRSAVLVHRDRARPDLAESLPASTRKLLRFLGQLDAVDAACFHPNYGNLSRWAAKEAVATSPDAGYHVARRDFDRCLREHARRQRARIVDGEVQLVDWPPSRTSPFGAPGPPSLVSIQVRTADGATTQYHAEFVLDCSGRAGVIARKGLRRFDAGYRTLAVAAEWVCESWPENESAHTIVDSYEDGWAWSVPLSPTKRQCTVMIDHDRTSRTGRPFQNGVGRPFQGRLTKADLGALYRSELSKAKSIDARLALATQVSEPWACDATLYGAVRAADDRVLLVGDAASFIEPLSAAGVKKALTSGWRAAVVVNTCLEHGDRLSAAFDFFDRREQQVYRDCLARSAVFFQDAANAHGGAFWTTRAASSRSSPSEPIGEPIERDWAADPGVQRAFERLSQSADVRVIPTCRLQFAATAAIEGREIVMRDGIVFPGVEAPVRFAAGVNLPELSGVAAACSDLRSVVDGYRLHVGTIDVRELLTGLSVLVAAGMLEISDPARSAR